MLGPLGERQYSSQLEQTVTKLQAALGYTPEQVSALPPSSVTIRELQQDNMRLQREVEELRRALNEAGGSATRRSSIAPYPDPRLCDRDSFKRRKASCHLDSMYLVRWTRGVPKLKPLTSLTVLRCLAP